MDLKHYFDKRTGLGVLSTADDGGRVNSAVYARPHCFDDGTLGFIMPERLTHHNLQTNGYATYLFCEDPPPEGSRYAGVRIYLKKVGEDDDPARIAELRRRAYGDERDGRHLVLFAVDKQLPLVGAGEDEVLPVE